MDLVKSIVRNHPEMKAQLRKARMNTTPEAFVTRCLRMALMIGLMLGVLVFFYTDKQGLPLYWPFVALAVSTWFSYWYFMQSPILEQAKVAADIDREVLFAGRFLLVKLNSGKPLVNALVEASQSYGVSNKYFLEIVRDIELGTPLEEAIEHAMHNSPSKHWRSILFQIQNALRLGIDVRTSLEAVLEEISHDYLLQIQRYGKKLSSITLFYLLLAVVFPSLGMTILVVLLSFAGLQLSWGMLSVILILVLFVQVVFMRVFMSIRPKVNL